MMQYRAGEIVAYLEIGRALRHGGCRCKAPLAVTETLMDEIAGRMTQDEFFALAIRLTALPNPKCIPFPRLRNPSTHPEKGTPAR